MLRKGDIVTVDEVTEDENGTLVHIDNGYLLGIVQLKGVVAGAKMQIGPVCGDWCRVFVKGDTYRAQILQTPQSSVSSSH